MSNDKTIFIQVDYEVEETLNSYCDVCGIKLEDAYYIDRYGCIEVYVQRDKNDDIIGLLCPECAGGE